MKKPQRRKPQDITEPPVMVQVTHLKERLHQAEAANMQFAREKARRTDQFKALLQVANLLLVVASNEIVRRESDYE